MDVSLRETLRVNFDDGGEQGGKPLFNWWAEQDSNLQPDRYERWRADKRRRKTPEIIAFRLSPFLLGSRQSLRFHCGRMRLASPASFGGVR